VSVKIFKIWSKNDSFPAPPTKMCSSWISSTTPSYSISHINWVFNIFELNALRIVSMLSLAVLSWLIHKLSLKKVDLNQKEKYLDDLRGIKIFLDENHTVILFNKVVSPSKIFSLTHWLNNMHIYTYYLNLPNLYVINYGFTLPM